MYIHTTVIPKGEASHRTPALGGIGAVYVGPELTIQSSEASHLRQLAEELYRTAAEMEQATDHEPTPA